MSKPQLVVNALYSFMP